MSSLAHVHPALEQNSLTVFAYSFRNENVVHTFLFARIRNGGQEQFNYGWQGLG